MINTMLCSLYFDSDTDSNPWPLGCKPITLTNSLLGLVIYEAGKLIEIFWVPPVWWPYLINCFLFLLYFPGIPYSNTSNLPNTHQVLSSWQFSNASMGFNNTVVWVNCPGPHVISSCSNIRKYHCFHTLSIGDMQCL